MIRRRRAVSVTMPSTVVEIVSLVHEDATDTRGGEPVLVDAMGRGPALEPLRERLSLRLARRCAGR